MTLKFRSRESYLKWLAFKHIHLKGTKSKQLVKIGGRPHKVCHNDVCEAKRKMFN